MALKRESGPPLMRLRHARARLATTHMRFLRHAAALCLLAAGLVGCGGTITYGGSTFPSKQQPSAVAYTPIEPPLTPPPGTTDGNLLAFDAKTGNSLWHSEAPMADMGQPVVAGGLVFVHGGYGGPHNILAAFDSVNGHPTWRMGMPAICGEDSVGPAIFLVIGCIGAAAGPPSMLMLVSARDPKTGRELWTATGVAAAAGSGTVLLIVPAPSGDFKVRGLDALTGHQLWEANLTVTNIPPLVNGQVALVQRYGCLTSASPPDINPSSCSGPGQASSFVSRLDPATGNQLWQTGFGKGSQVRRLLLGDVAVFSVDVELPPPPGQLPPAVPPPGAIGALDPATGMELWRQTVSTELSIPAVAAPGTVYVEQTKPSSALNQCPTNRLDALDSKSGTPRWLIDNLPACEMFVDADGHTVVLVLTSFSGTKIVVLDSVTGTELWEKPMPSSGLYPLVHASVSGGVVYVSESGHFGAPSPPAGD